MDVTKNQLKYVKSLQQIKFRQIYKNFIGEGHKVAMELLGQSKFEIESIFATQEWLNQHPSVLKDYTHNTFLVTDEQMMQISSLKNPTNVLIVVKQKLIELSSVASEDGNYFYLDNIQDPGNVGTIIRLADWFGFKGVIASTSTADFFNPKVVQATMGSIVGPALIEAPISHLSSYLSLYQIYGMEMKGVALSEANFSNRNIIILGNEGHGLSHEAKSLIKEKNYLTIPGFDGKIAESLNVSVAAGILAHHLYQL